MDAPPCEPAGIGRRIGAYLIDTSIVVAIYLVVLVLAVAVQSSALLALATLAILGYAVYVWWALATTGQSLGKRALGLRLVSVDDGQPIGWGRVLLRGLVVGALSTFTFGIGVLVLAVVASGHPRKQGWHDLAVDSIVVDLSRPLPASAGPPVAQPSRTAPVTLPAGGTPAAAPPPVGAPGSLAPVGPTGGPLAPVAGAQAPLTTSALAGAPVPQPAATAAPRSADPADRTPRPSSAARSGVIASVPSSFAPPPVAPAQEEPRLVSPIAPGPPAGDVQPLDSVVDEQTRMVRRSARVGTWQLHLGDGKVIDVTGLGLLGRNPQPREGEHVEHLLTIPDPHRSVSKTHLSFGLDQGRLWVEDRGSTNGSALLAGDGSRTELVPGRKTEPTQDAVLVLGQESVTVSLS